MVWLRAEFPWLGGGFIPAVADGYADTFARELVERGFDLHTMSGDGDLFAELGRALDFPDYYGGSGWDAVNDCMHDIHPASPTALIWQRADVAAARDPKRFGEACAILTAAFDEFGRQGVQVVLVLVGEGPAFKHP